MKKKVIKKETQRKENPGKNPQGIKQAARFKFHKLAGITVIILLGIVIYSNSFKCSFHFDDNLHIVNNTKIQNLSDVKTWWSYSPRPVSIFTFVLNYHFNRLDVWYYHLVNLIIHLINACLVLLLTVQIFSSQALKDHPLSKHKRLLAFFTALLFVSHPLATQSVTYIMQRQSSLAALFYLLSLTLYMKARLHHKPFRYEYLLYAASVVSAFLAVLSKENAYTLPAAIILLEIFFVQTRKISVNFRNYRVILLVAAFAGILVFAFFNFSFSVFDPLPPLESEGRTYTITPRNYFFTQFSVIVKYIQLLILPVNQNLDHDITISNNFFEIKTWLSLLFLLLLFILALILFKKYRILSFGIFWFFITLSVESGIIPISDVIYEHRTYLPSFGFFLILSTGIFILLWNKSKYLAIGLLSVIIVINSFLSYERNKVWKDDITLWTDVAEKSPGKARPFINRGLAYASQGQIDKALADLSVAVEITPSCYIFWNRGNIYSSLQQWDKAIDDYSNLVRIDTGYKDGYYNRGIAYDNIGDRDKAIADYSRVICIDPYHLNAYNNRGADYHNQGQLDKAIADYSSAIKINAEYAFAYENRAAAFSALGQWDKAIDDYSRLIRITGGENVRALINRGKAYSSLGEWDKALNDFSGAIELEPNNTEAINNRDIAMRNLNNNK
ncbi:MAG TPA: tetratricopeptide repeat protein [Bacteroidales bacterium]|nr:tetratricopeptide repeat protein [Bacteroidales bacterium]